jgi:uncharacterized repeat protein (TIGR03803 family)
MCSRSRTASRILLLGWAWACVCACPLPAVQAAGFQVVHSFTNATQAAVPFGSVFENDGWLYGTTVWNQSAGSRPPTGTGAGSVYRIRPDGSDFEVLQAFTSATDGGNLFHGLVIDAGSITGVARNGGHYGFGTLFQLAHDGSTFDVLHHFGATGDGRHPYNAPVAVGDTLYGLTFQGGASNVGVLYSYDRGTATYSARRSFPNPGGQPFGSLIPVGDWLYGMVSDHRRKDAFGEIFRFRPSDDAYEVVHTFLGGSQGGYPYDSLIWDGGSFVYGTTLGYYPFTHEQMEGPLGDEGVIFRLNVDTSAYEVIHDFSLTVGDGAKPNSAMLIGPDGLLYGIAHGAESWGGPGYEFGTLYRLRTDGADFEVLHTFDSMENGDTPMRSLLWLDGYLYGTTAFGGEGDGVGNGTIWRYAAVPEPGGLGCAAVAAAMMMCTGRRRTHV